MILALLLAIVLLVVGVSIIGFTLHVLWLLLIGLIIGGFARLVIPGRQNMGLLATALYGVAGSFGGDLIARALNAGSFVQFLLAVVVTAVLLLVVGGAYQTAHINEHSRV